MGRIRKLELSGSPYEIGMKHGKTYHDEIHMFTEDRVELSQNMDWTGRNLSREAVIALAEACVAEHQAYAPDLMQELQGMADATGLSLAELVINNGFTDFIDVVYGVGDLTKQAVTPRFASDNCTAFLVPNDKTPDKHGFFGQTWDMHDTATPYVILIDGKPDNAPDFLAFTITGCVGMIGMNSEGISVGINNLMSTDGQIGVTWPFVIRKILQQDNLDDALECITSAKLAGAHNYLLMDKSGDGYNVEAMSTSVHVQKLDQDSIAHTNHCLIDKNLEVSRERKPASQQSSENRLNRAYELLENNDVTVDDLIALTRDEQSICTRPKPPMNVESCGAAIMRPATGDFWAVWGLPVENEYEHFVI
jgi:isopenicillin-N N-acyltransferase like protein